MSENTLFEQHLDGFQWGRRNGLYVRTADSPAVEATVHIVDDDGVWLGSDLVTALCGRTGRFDEDGDMATRGFHFVEPPDEGEATCRWCREAAVSAPPPRSGTGATLQVT